MSRPALTVIEKFNILLLTANAEEIAEMKQAFHYHSLFVSNAILANLKIAPTSKSVQRRKAAQESPVIGSGMPSAAE